MMKKKTQYTNITPIPSFIPRQLAIDMLQSHGEIIELNPLVTGYEAIKAPRNAPADEFYATWYEISQRIQYIPGIGKLGSGAIKFNGCFHDMPWGLQTHTYAPAGVDLRNKWQICGNQPGEPPVPQELGLGAPPEGLYLREDIEIKCNVAMISFVKKETQAASKKMVERLIKKAELLDAGIIQGMMENGKLKTINPADRRSDVYKSSPHPSPTQPYNMPMMSPSRSPTLPHHARGQSSTLHPQHLVGTNHVVMELPGDYPPTSPSPSPGLLSPNAHAHHSHRASTASSDMSSSSATTTTTTTTTPAHSPAASNARWSQGSHSSPASSRPSSYAPSEPMRSPGLDPKPFAAELPTMKETREEHDARRQSEPNAHPAAAKYVYNPQDYIRTTAQFAPAPPYQAPGGFVHGQGGYQPHLREGWHGQ
ncbi:hypothetical protein ACEQ8H_004562 [Pleosporales sp. CAS-2024a]